MKAEQNSNYRACRICGESELEMLEQFGSLPRVTSDCKPWPAGGTLAVCARCGAIQKLADQKWLDEIARIYRDYDIYHLSAGVEQVVFDSRDAVPRSNLLVEYVVRHGGLGARGRMLDIGCGNGAALINFSEALPEWQLYGSELTTKALSCLRRLPNFVHLYTDPPAQIRERFGLVSMIHSLEHMTVPLQDLRDACSLLDEEGRLFIESPDVETSPFDLLIADHLMHFSSATITYLLMRAGAQVVALAKNVVPKELTVLARPAASTLPRPKALQGRRTAYATVNWLGECFELARSLARSAPIGIFGTSIAGMALYGGLRGRVAFFVDEDRTRIGCNYEGVPIVAPLGIQAAVPVLVALPRPMAERVVARLAGTAAHFVLPPPFPEL